jgi:hypothetical protein
MIVRENELLLLQPSKRGYGLEKGEICNSVFSDNNFTIFLKFKVDKINGYNDEPIFIFTKVPNWFLVSINKVEQDYHLYIHYIVNEVDIIQSFYFDFKFNKYYNLLITYSNENKKLNLKIDGNDFEIDFTVNKMSEIKADDPYIFIGSADHYYVKKYNMHFDFLLMAKKILSMGDVIDITNEYPVNKDEYNLYLNKDKYNLLGLWNFKEKTTFNVFDFTGNNNHLKLEINEQ